MSHSYFKNSHYKNIFLEHYEKIVDEFDFEIGIKNKKTSYGNTSLIYTLNSNKPSLFLLHGLDACAPLILKQFSFLRKDYQLFAIDVLGQPNKSDEIRLCKKNDSYVFWMNEIVSELSLTNISVLGYSFGAFIALKTALKCNFNISNLFLFSPAGIVNGNLITQLSKIVFPFLQYKITKQEKHLVKGLKEIYTDVNKDNINYMKHILLQYKSDMSYTPILKPKELANIKCNIHLFTASDDILFPAKKLANRLSKNTNINVINLNHAKHVLGKKQLKEVAFYFKTTPIN